MMDDDEDGRTIIVNDARQESEDTFDLLMGYEEKDGSLTLHVEEAQVYRAAGEEPEVRSVDNDGSIKDEKTHTGRRLVEDSFLTAGEFAATAWYLVEKEKSMRENELMLVVSLTKDNRQIPRDERYRRLWLHLRTASLMSRLDAHPCIQQVRGAFSIVDDFYFFFENCEAAIFLKDMLIENEQNPISLILDIGVQLALALEYLNKYSCTLWNLSSDTILVRNLNEFAATDSRRSGRISKVFQRALSATQLHLAAAAPNALTKTLVKITNFREATIRTKKNCKYYGFTPAYGSPETYDLHFSAHRSDEAIKRAGQTQDIWSFGVLLFECIAGQRCWHDHRSMRDVFLEFSHGRRNVKGRNSADHALVKKVLALIKRCISPRLSKRPSMIAIIKELANISGTEYKSLRSQEQVYQTLDTAEKETLHFELGRAFQEYDESVDAAFHLNKYQEIVLDRHGVQSSEYATSLLVTARVYAARSLFDPAIQLQMESLKIRKKINEKDDPLLADVYESLAHTHQAKGSINEAIVYSQNALNIRRMRQVDHPLGVAQGLESLGSLLMADKRTAQAKGCYEAALSLRSPPGESVDDPEDPDLAKCITNLGRIEMMSEHLDRSVEYFERAIEIWDRTAADHPDLAAALNDFGVACQAKSCLVQAISLHGRALEIRKVIMGVNHPLVAESLEHLADAALNLGRLAEAEHYMTQASLIRHENGEYARSDGKPNLVGKSCSIFESYTNVSSSKLSKKQRGMIESETKSELAKIFRLLVNYATFILADEVNRYRLSRSLQESIVTITSQEGLLMLEIVESLDANIDLHISLRRGFNNKNVGRMIVKALQQFDFLWHNSTRLNWARILDFFGDFPQTELNSAAFSNTVNLLVRSVLPTGSFVARYLTGNREGLITDGAKKTPAINLAANAGLESVARSQHNTTQGRHFISKFRHHNRLPIDESIVRNFAVDPVRAIADNGVEHVLLAITKHWQYTLTNEPGNFAHQRQELLDPANTLRITFPIMLTELAALRGVNRWDAKVLRPFILKLELFEPQVDYGSARALVDEFNLNILCNTCDNVQSRMEPLQKFAYLLERAFTDLTEEVKKVHSLLISDEVRDGITLGLRVVREVATQSIPSNKDLQSLIKVYILGKHYIDDWLGIAPSAICTALEKLNPKDRRTLIDLTKEDIKGSKILYFLIRRVTSLLKRQIIRHRYDEEIARLNKVLGISVGRKIVAAQKCWMMIELVYLQRFSLSAYLDNPLLRDSLLHLQVVAQVHCCSVDFARIERLDAIKSDASKKRIYEPQNLMIIGGGPTSLLTALHSLENCVRTNGVVSVHEKRDDYRQAGSNFQRAQVVRLDPRWIAMLRMHCGTGFEDVFTPLAGETMAHLANFLVEMGFVELTIKQLEDLLQFSVATAQSRGLLHYYTGSAVEINHDTISITCSGASLKPGLKVRISTVSEAANLSRPLLNGELCQVMGLEYPKAHTVNETLIHGKEYMLHFSHFERLMPAIYNTCYFEPCDADMKEMCGNITFDGQTILATGECAFKHLDSRTNTRSTVFVYPQGADIDMPAAIRFKTCESIDQKFSVDLVKVQKLIFSIDIANTHVVAAKGKPYHSDEHLSVTVHEEYGVCCLAGLKVSYIMHQFGVPRWRSGFINDVRSIVEENTRLISDFTKAVSQQLIAAHMLETIKKPAWRGTGERLFAAAENIPRMRAHKFNQIEIWVEEYKERSKDFYRSTLQQRVFETGDNSYVGMELPREFKQLQTKLCDDIHGDLLGRHGEKIASATSKSVATFLDKLFFQAALDVLRKGDVFNPGANAKIPTYRLVADLTEQPLCKLKSGDAFLVAVKHLPKSQQVCLSLGQRQKRFEVLHKTSDKGRRLCFAWRRTQKISVLIRDMEGRVSRMNSDTPVFLADDLTRAPDGENQSKVSFATFPVAHYVNDFGVRIIPNADHTDSEYGFFPAGDNKASPHFMRYSGLTGAGISAMEVARFIGGVVSGKSPRDRFQSYLSVSQWSDFEVVTRGIGAGYGEDGFLRPGFKYLEWIRHVHRKVQEYSHFFGHFTTVTEVFSEGWLTIFASSLIPRGLEHDDEYLNSLRTSVQYVLDTKFGFKEDYVMRALEASIQRAVDLCEQPGGRVSSQESNQPASVDRVFVNQGIEANGFINGFTNTAMFQASGLAASQQSSGSLVSGIGSTLGAISPILAFASVTNANLYKRRNEDHQAHFVREQLPRLKRSLYASCDIAADWLNPDTKNPYIEEIRQTIIYLERTLKYDRREMPADLASDLNALVHELDVSRWLNHDNLIPRLLTRTKDLIASEFHALTYSKDVMTILINDLEKLHEAKMNMRHSAPNRPSDLTRAIAGILYRKICDWESRVYATLEEGDVYLGSFRKRKWSNSHLIAITKFIEYGLLPRKLRHWLPKGKYFAITSETKEILEALRDFNKRLKAEHKSGSKEVQRSLDKEIHDLEEFYAATIEVYKVSLIIVAGAVSGTASALAIVAAISKAIAHDSASRDILISSTAILGIVAPIPALLSLPFIFKQKHYQYRLSSQLEKKLKATEGVDATTRQVLIKCQKILNRNGIITDLRGGTAAFASAALISAAAGAGAPMVPALAVAAISTGACAFAGSLYVQYQHLYKLPENTPAHVAEAFRQEIEEMYQLYFSSGQYTHSAILNARDAWAYTARTFLHEYRFDVLFDLPRYNSMFQYIQSGMRQMATIPEAVNESAGIVGEIVDDDDQQDDIVDMPFALHREIVVSTRRAIFSASFDRPTSIPRRPRRYSLPANAVYRPRRTSKDAIELETATHSPDFGLNVAAYAQVRTAPQASEETKECSNQAIHAESMLVNEYGLPQTSQHSLHSRASRRQVFRSERLHSTRNLRTSSPAQDFLSAKENRA